MFITISDTMVSRAEKEIFMMLENVTNKVPDVGPLLIHILMF